MSNISDMLYKAYPKMRIDYISFSDFNWWMDTIAPGKNDLVVLMQAYFDESMGDGITVVAGAMLRKSKAKILNKKWARMMRHEGKGVSIFHMKDVAHGNDDFDSFTDHERDVLARKAIKIFAEEVEVFSAISLRDDDFYAQPSPIREIQDPHTFACWFCLMGLNLYMDEYDAEGKIAFLFEAGANDQSSANKMMHNLFSNPHQRDSYRYCSHSFASKPDERLLQAGDMLAWHWLQDRKRKDDGRERRKDFARIKAENRNIHVHANAAQVQRIFKKMANPS